jgi:hypothetical protein
LQDFGQILVQLQEDPPQTDQYRNPQLLD